MQGELQDFIKAALAKGRSRKEINEVLREAGWDEAERKEGLSAFLDTDFPIPVPRRKPYLSAREAFLYLLMFLTLYISAYHFGALIFQFINRWIPDPLQSYGIAGYYDLRSVRFSVASLIVAFPLFFWMSHLLRRTLVKHPEKRGSRVKKWLTYLTLFVSAGIMIGTVIAFLFDLLNGELTTRFVLKVFTMLFIAGVVFGYYLWDLRQEEREE